MRASYTHAEENLPTFPLKLPLYFDYWMRRGGRGRPLLKWHFRGLEEVELISFEMSLLPLCTPVAILFCKQASSLYLQRIGNHVEHVFLSGCHCQLKGNSIRLVRFQPRRVSDILPWFLAMSSFRLAFIVPFPWRSKVTQCEKLHDSGKSSSSTPSFQLTYEAWIVVGFWRPESRLQDIIGK